MSQSTLHQPRGKEGEESKILYEEVYSMKEQIYKVCATCINFEAIKTESGMKYRCKRLGFDTKPSHSFDCWDPKPHVKKLMEKRKNYLNHDLTDRSLVERLPDS